MKEILVMDESLRILVVGGGAREHGLVWKLVQSKKTNAIFCAPGNGGISDIAKCVDIRADEISRLVGFSRRENINLVVVGPENALAAGITDAFEKKGAEIPVFGPSKKAAEIETSKVFAKCLMNDYGIPTAQFSIFNTYKGACEYIRKIDPPYVIKADGLCAGKGAFIVKKTDKAERILKFLFLKRGLGEAGTRIIIEDFIPGFEISCLSFSDGEYIVSLPSSQDHKAIFDGDRGPNTGGMGAYTPVPFVDEKILKEIDEQVMLKTVRAMRDEKREHKGILYGGLMFQGKEKYSVLEFNARFGDPETQPILFGMKSDIVPYIQHSINGGLWGVGPIEQKKGVALCVVLASRGYPEQSEIGKLITGLDAFKGAEDIFVFHSGTVKRGDKYYTAGGRVLSVTVLGSNYKNAIEKAYDAIKEIHFEGMQYRTDIGQKALQYAS